MNQNSPLSFSNIFKRETKLAAYFIICLTLVVLSVSYALFFSVDNNTANQEVTAGDLKFTYANGNTITSSDEGSETKQKICFQPMSDDEAELYWNECSYKFSVQNTGTLNSTYSISLSALSDNNIDVSKLKVILRKVEGETKTKEDGFPKAMDTLTKTGDTSSEYSLLQDIDLGAKKTVVYQVQIYVDESQYNDDDSTKTIDFQINGKGIVNEKTELDPAVPFNGPFDDPQETIDEATGNGLYEVKHDDAEITDGGGVVDVSGWKQTEWRYGGPNPNNYVWFNCGPGTSSGDTCEKWRIIGLVNVKTSSGEIEQRLKIIRDKPLEGYYVWNKKENGSNDWTQASLMKMLNGIYYNSQNGECWKGNFNDSASQKTCKFDGMDGGERGLSATARGMIDKDITWNIGGWGAVAINTPAVYAYERGIKTGSSDMHPAEWNSTNTMAEATFNSVGLMYPSDYLYASAGSNDGTTRNDCINNNTYAYGHSGCHEKDWILTTEKDEWFLTPEPSYFYVANMLCSLGSMCVSHVYYSHVVRPVVYLSLNVSITDGKGTESEPYILTAE